jgi:hypothetical protein
MTCIVIILLLTVSVIKCMLTCLQATKKKHGILLAILKTKGGIVEDSQASSHTGLAGKELKAIVSCPG